MDAYATTFKAKGQQQPMRLEQFAQPYPPQWKFTMHDLRVCSAPWPSILRERPTPWCRTDEPQPNGQRNGPRWQAHQEALRKHMQELENELLRYATALPQIQMED